MGEKKDILVPAINNRFPKVKRDYPISERENLWRAFNHEKPLWMPNFEGVCQDMSGYTLFPGHLKEEGELGTNYWGIQFQYSVAQGSSTPISKAMNDVTEWKEALHFPNIADLGLEERAAGFVRDESLLVCGHVDSVCFEHLHTLEGFEQALMDLILEPDTCRELFERLVDHQLEILKKQIELYNYDFVIYHDDWGTQRGPFFSIDLFKETILPPTKRFIQTIRDSGMKVMVHNCGLIDDFIPYIVEEIGCDALQIQIINDVAGIIQKYGDIVTVEYRRPDPWLLFDPDTTLDQVRALARDVVDRYGAHVNPGAGAVCTINAPTAEVYNAFDEEMVSYSMGLYKNLKG